jgi:hypothetical protein
MSHINGIISNYNVHVSKNYEQSHTVEYFKNVVHFKTTCN